MFANKLKLLNNLSTKSFSLVRYSPNESIARLTLSSPKTRNSLGLEMVDTISKTIDKINTDKPKVVIIDAEGPVFSAGHNLKELLDKEDNNRVFKAHGDLIIKLKASPSIFISKINGVCAAGGFQLALATDLIYCTDHSKFTTAGIKVGVFCTTPAVELIRTTTIKRAFEMCITGDLIDARQAKEFGFINDYTTEDKLEELVQARAAVIASYSGQVLGFGKRAFYEQTDIAELSKAYEVGAERMCQNVHFEDTQEGLKAFAEKRKAIFKH